MAVKLIAIFLVTACLAVFGNGEGTCTQSDIIDCTQQLTSFMNGNNQSIDFSAFCPAFKSAMECFRNLKSSCPSSVWDALNEQFMKGGLDINVDQNDCCNLIVDVQTNCIQQTQFPNGLDASNAAQCKTVEKAWTCVDNKNTDIKKDCKTKLFTDGIKIGKDTLVKNLDECVAAGQNVTVPYKGPGGSASQTVPAMAFVLLSAFLVGLIASWF